MIMDLNQFAARGVAAQKAADAIIALANSATVTALVVIARQNIAMCKITTSVKFQCPLCERIVTGTHECRRNPKGGGK